MLAVGWTCTLGMEVYSCLQLAAQMEHVWPVPALGCSHAAGLQGAHAQPLCVVGPDPQHDLKLFSSST